MTYAFAALFVVTLTLTLAAAAAVLARLERSLSGLNLRLTGYF